ncbi:hypothetical protein PENSPDRAFT_99288 [Peniophora sp. CONT]|nr:hypothetical protein PENSPDRAFT_99288 [Peniophora sp. CONT]
MRRDRACTQTKHNLLPRRTLLRPRRWEGLPSPASGAYTGRGRPAYPQLLRIQRPCSCALHSVRFLPVSLTSGAYSRDPYPGHMLTLQRATPYFVAAGQVVPVSSVYAPPTVGLDAVLIGSWRGRCGSGCVNTRPIQGTNFSVSGDVNFSACHPARGK